MTTLTMNNSIIMQARKGVGTYLRIARMILTPMTQKQYGRMKKHGDTTN